MGPEITTNAIATAGENPLEDLGAVTNTENLKVIMKDGRIYKNTIQ